MKRGEPTLRLSGAKPMSTEHNIAKASKAAGGGVSKGITVGLALARAVDVYANAVSGRK